MLPKYPSNISVAPIPSPEVLEESSSGSESENDLESCSDTESETEEEIILSSSGMKINWNVFLLDLNIVSKSCRGF